MLSIVIPLFNKEESIRYCLNSVFKQSYTNFELIIVNDGSTDKSPEIISEFVRDKRLRLIHQSNKGVSAARNEGIRQSNGNWICFLDADDVWDKNYLSNVSKLIKKYPQASMIGHAYYQMNTNNILIDFGLPPKFEGYIEDYFSHVSSKRRTLYFTSATCVQRSVFDEIGGFDKRIRRGQDLDMWFRIALNYKIVYCDRRLVYYKVDSENNSKQIKDIKSWVHHFLLDKHYALYKQESNFKYFVNYFLLFGLFRYFFLNENREAIKDIVKRIEPNTLMHYVMKNWYLLYYTLSKYL